MTSNTFKNVRFDRVGCRHLLISAENLDSLLIFTVSKYIPMLGVDGGIGHTIEHMANMWTRLSPEDHPDGNCAWTVYQNDGSMLIFPENQAHRPYSIERNYLKGIEYKDGILIIKTKYSDNGETYELHPDGSVKETRGIK